MVFVRDAGIFEGGVEGLEEEALVTSCDPEEVEILVDGVGSFAGGCDEPLGRRGGGEGADVREGVAVGRREGDGVAELSSDSPYRGLGRD